MTRIRSRLVPLAFVALGLLVAAASTSRSHGVTFTPTASAGAPKLPSVLKGMPVAAGDTAILFANQNFTVTGSCIDNGGGDYTAEAYIATQQDGGLLYTAYHGSDTDFNIADGPIQIADAAHSASGTSTQFLAYDYYQEAFAVSGDGSATTARVATGVHLYGADCIFSGLFLDRSSTPKPHGIKKFPVGTTNKSLFSDGHFNVTASCIDNGGGSYTARVQLFALKDHAIVRFANGAGQDLDFNKADGGITISEVTASTPLFDGEDYRKEIVGIPTKGQTLTARAAAAVHAQGADCEYSGVFINAVPLQRFAKVPHGRTVTLFQNDLFKVNGTCVDNGGGNYTARADLSVRQDGTKYFISDNDAMGTLNRDDAPLAFDNYAATGATPALSGWDYHSEVYVQAPGGEVLIVRIISGVHVLGDDCGFSGLFQK